MARTRLQTEISKITRAMDRASGKDLLTDKRKKDLYEALFFLLAGDPQLKPELREFCKNFKCEGALNWVMHVISREVKLPQALHARTIKKMSLRNVLSTWNVKRSDLKLVEEIAATAGLNLQDEHVLMRKYYSSMDLRWLGEVEEELDEVEVIINRQAMQDLLLGVLETYKVPKSKSMPYSEVFGLCLGMASRQKIQKKGVGTRTKWFVHVEKAVPQIRAKSRTDSVIPNLKSIEAVIEAASTLFPQLEIIGDYHSHPYRTVKRLKDVHGWEASPSDCISVAELYMGLRKHPKRKHRLRVTFVVAIAKGRPSNSTPAILKGRRNIVHMSTAGCRIFISAYRILSNGEMTSHGVTMVPTMQTHQLEAI